MTKHIQNVLFDIDRPFGGMKHLPKCPVCLRRCAFYLRLEQYGPDYVNANIKYHKEVCSVCKTILQTEKCWRCHETQRLPDASGG